ncbi:MAG: fumarylacetoacetate hydrolase family protein [Bacteroidia bacterium]|nr:fumarylacetoacetate hydrolase family protein [Bacteroidia bacterium]
MKIICIGRNYAAHAAELKNEVPGSPVFFLKPETSLLARGNDFYIPSFSADIHYECELVFRICREGKKIEERFAHRYADAVSTGIDFTARDIQEDQKRKGLPWEPSKAFDHSAPVGSWIPLDAFPDPGNIAFYLDINGSRVQEGNSGRMIFPLTRIISYVSGYITLKKGDILFTGTPEGVGKVSPGDELRSGIGQQELLSLKIR